MANTTSAGTLLIRTDTLLPEAVVIDSEPYASGWRRVTRVTNVTGYELGLQAHAAGWNFFLQAGSINSIAFGLNRQKTAGRAVAQILAKLTSSQYNSLEITRATSKSLWGLSRSSISANLRHIQKSPFLFRTKDAAA